jgi:hypothetical protein
MKDDELPQVPQEGAVRVGADARTSPPGSRSLATRDHGVIRQWAARHTAQPAIDNRDVRSADGVGSVVRFNFPGLHRYVPTSWDEWFTLFDEYQLIFVYEEDVADRAYELWQRRDAADGTDLSDWVAAEQQLHGEGIQPTGGYRFARKQKA